MKKQFFLVSLLLSLVLVNSCLKEHSLENGNGPSEGTLQDDGTGDCLPKTVSGTYVVGTALNGNLNFIEVQVDVTTAGNFTIYTDTVNGMYFRAAGVFTTTGLNTVHLKGFGTPVNAEISNFVVIYGLSSCTIAVTTSASLAVFTLDGAPNGCMGATPAGTYTAGTALTTANTVTIHVNVTSPGAYSISTAPSNGIVFTGSGTLVAGNQTIVLSAAGSTPTTAGTTTIPVSVTNGSTTSNCSFPITVGSSTATAVFTVDCATATPQGTYTVGTPLDPATNKVVLTVNVTTAGTYTINATGGGMTFTVSGTFASAGTGQTVTLVATTGNPTTAGANTIQLTGGTANCSFPINVNPGGPGAAVFTIDCATAATFNGTYTQSSALIAANTMVISVNVTTIGTYSISGAANNMTFASAAGASFTATGVQPVTLTGTGTPNVSGTVYVPVTVGTNTCYFRVLVVAPSAVSDYFPRTTNSNWSYEFADVAGDSVLSKVISNTHTALGNTYNIFMVNDGSGFDTLGYYRKAGNDYYHYVDLAGYLGLDNTQRVEFIFIKDNQPAGTQWTSAPFVNAAGGFPATFRIRFKITQKDVPITLTTSTGTITYPNTIVVEEHYEVDPGTGTYVSLDDQFGYYVDYYSRNIGWIKDEFIDELGALDPGSTMRVRRFIVY